MHFLCVTGGIYVSLILMKKQNKIKFGEQATCTKQKIHPLEQFQIRFYSCMEGKKKLYKRYDNRNHPVSDRAGNRFHVKRTGRWITWRKLIRSNGDCSNSLCICGLCTCECSGYVYQAKTCLSSHRGAFPAFYEAVYKKNLRDTTRAV